MIYKYAGKLLSDCSGKETCCNRRINSTGQGKKYFAIANGYKSVSDMAERTIGQAKFNEMFGGVPEWIRASPDGEFIFVGINPILFN